MGDKIDTKTENDFTNSQVFRELAVWCTDRALKETYPYTTLPNNQTKSSRRQKLQEDGYLNTPLRPSIQLYQNVLPNESTRNKQNPIRRSNTKYNNNNNKGKSRWKDSNKAFRHHAKPSAAIRSYNNLNAYSSYRKRKIDHKLLVRHITSSRCHVDRPFKGNLMTPPNSGKIQYVSVGNYTIPRENEKEISNVIAENKMNSISKKKGKLEKPSGTSETHVSFHPRPSTTKPIRVHKHKANNVTNKRLSNIVRVPFPVSILEVGKPQPVSEDSKQRANTPASQNLVHKGPFKTHKVLKLPHTLSNFSLNTPKKNVICCAQYSPIQMLNIDFGSYSSSNNKYDIYNYGARRDGDDDNNKAVQNTELNRIMKNKKEYALPKKSGVNKIYKEERNETMPLLITNNPHNKSSSVTKSEQKILSEIRSKRFKRKDIFSFKEEHILPVINQYSSQIKTRFVDRADALLNIKEYLKQLNQKITSQKFTREKVQQII